ncbi:hypothetical protein [Lacimonas salitolerans]|uniref:Uncharacterized protein n=1 Tax=Lacimonas salitolerans TaxID=1323750 RepID=A0ABW4EF15_9RHOB
MSSVPLPVRLGWYAWRYAATSAEIQMRMTRAMITTLREARPLAPAGLKEVSKALATPAEAPAEPAKICDAQPAAKAAPEAAAAPAKAQTPPTHTAAKAPAKTPAKTAPKASASSPAKPRTTARARKRRTPSVPPVMPNGSVDG